MNKFIKELNEGEIHFRDNLQFELKSEFSPPKKDSKFIVTQAFYIFTPSALDITSETYSKSNFYKDQTNFIRYKTPQFTLSELIDEKNRRSPIYKIPKMNNTQKIESELKLLGNIIRSALRRDTQSYLEILNKTSAKTKLKELVSSISKWIKEIKILRSKYLIIQNDFLTKEEEKQHPKHVFEYVDEFLGNSIEYYLTGLLNHLRKKNDDIFKGVDTKICTLLTEEQTHRKKQLYSSLTGREENSTPEFLLYRRGLLNKFILNALRLKINRTDIKDKWNNLIGGIAAGIAMFIYFTLFIWQGSIFVFNSFPFIVITTFLYILKDRMKEGLRNLFFKKAYQWFPDYTTEIFSPNGKNKIGQIKESEIIIPQHKLPKEISEIRNTQFHTELEKFQRLENIIIYKKSIKLYKSQADQKEKKKFELNNIFRFNIQDFLKKAGNPTQDFFVLDSKSKELKKKRLPKVYHINIILQTTFPSKKKQLNCECKKYRLVIDKNGIKRVEVL